MTTVPVERQTRAGRLIRSSPALVLASAIILGVFVLVAVLAPWIAPYDPDAIDLANVYSGPSAAHWLGTDGTGRDTLSRLMYGARLSLTAPLLAILVATIVGTLLGLVAAWAGGVVDGILTRVFDVLFAFPALLLAMLGVALFGKGLTAPVIAVALAYSPYVAILVRSLVLAEGSRPYVAAYRVQGFSGPWTALRRVLPNVSPTILAQSTLNFGYALMDLAALSFLGLGVQPPTADWGAMINESRAAVLAGHPLSAVVPAIAVVLAVVAVNVVGDDLADRLAGRTRS